MVAADKVDLLSQTAPNWFNLTRATSEALKGQAIVPAANGVGKTVADIEINGQSGKIKITEAVIGTVFPANCPERHIEPDGAFCIGYEAGSGIHTLDQAVVWWGLLENFLRLQRIAARTRRWPVRQAIAHGDAGPHHLRALDAARELKLEEDYFQMLEGEPKWFSGRFPKLSKDSDRLLNGRLACPMGCLRKGRPILRRDCTRAAAVCRLLSEERLRRKKERQFWRDCRAFDMKCCGTMDNCPLA